MSDPIRTSAELDRIREESQLVVHDLRSPLHAILANLEFLQRSADAAHRDDAFADIRSSALHALRIVENLLELVRLDRGVRPVAEPVSPADVMAAALERRRAAARSRDVRLTLHRGSARHLAIDGILFARVLDNLLDNAFRHTPRGGRVELSVEDEPDRVRITLGNSGAAIPPELRERVFERDFVLPGRRGDRLNLGLGLPFCRRAVTAMGGTLHVEETEALPTVLVITFPV